jgi:hypothetical protein
VASLGGSSLKYRPTKFFHCKANPTTVARCLLRNKNLDSNKSAAVSATESATERTTSIMDIARYTLLAPFAVIGPPIAAPFAAVGKIIAPPIAVVGAPIAKIVAPTSWAALWTYKYLTSNG